MQTNLDELLSTYGRDRTSVGVYEDGDPQVERQVKALAQQMESERKENSAEYRRTAGKDVVYGQIVQLRHIKSKSYVSLTVKEAAELEKDSMRLILEKDGSEGSWFIIAPRLKMRSEGEPVNLGDQVAFISKKFNNFLFCSMKMSRTEVCGSPLVSPWRVIPFSPYVPPRATRTLNAGDVIRIFHKEIDGFLTSEFQVAQPGAELARGAATSTSKLFFESHPLQNTPRPATHHASQVAPSSNSNALWMVELENTMRGGMITFEHSVRFKHIPTGKYLACECIQENLHPEGTLSDLIHAENVAQANASFFGQPSTSATLSSSKLGATSSSPAPQSGLGNLTRNPQSSPLARVGTPTPHPLLGAASVSHATGSLTNLPAKIRVFMIDDPNTTSALFTFHSANNPSHSEGNVELDAFLRIRHKATKCWLHAAADEEVSTKKQPSKKGNHHGHQQHGANADPLRASTTNEGSTGTTPADAGSAVLGTERKCTDIDAKTAFFDSDVYVLAPVPPRDVRALYQVLGEIHYLQSYLVTLTRAVQHAFYRNDRRSATWLANDTRRLGKVLAALIEGCRSASRSSSSSSSSSLSNSVSLAASTDADAFDASRNASSSSLPNTRMQNLLREQNIADVLVAILARAFKNIKTAEELDEFREDPDHFALINACKLSYSLLRHIVIENDENRAYLSKYVPFMMSQVGYSIKAASTLMELFKDNYELATGITETTLQTVFISKLQTQPVIRYVQFLSVLCACRGVALTKNQDFITKCLIGDNPDSFLPIREIKTPIAGNVVLEMRVPTKSTFKWVPLAQLLDVVHPSSKAMDYLVESVELLAQLCKGGNIHTCTILSRFITPAMTNHCLENDALPPALRAVLCRLHLNLMLADKDIAKPVSFLNYTRLWSDINKEYWKQFSPDPNVRSSSHAVSSTSTPLHHTVAPSPVQAAEPTGPRLRKGVRIGLTPQSPASAATSFKFSNEDLKATKAFIMRYLQHTSSTVHGPGSEVNRLTAAVVEMGRYLFSFGRFSHDEIISLIPLLLKLSAQHTFPSSYLYSKPDEKIQMNINPYERSPLNKHIANFKYSIGQILDMACDYRTDCRLTQLLVLYKKQIDATSGDQSDAAPAPSSSSSLATATMNGIFSQVASALKGLVEDEVIPGLNNILELMALESNVYLPILSDFVLYQQPALATIGARLLVRHYSQKQELLDSLQNVQILVDPELVVTYQSVNKSLNTLKSTISASSGDSADTQRLQETALQVLSNLIALVHRDLKDSSKEHTGLSESTSNMKNQTAMMRIHEHQRLMINLKVEETIIELMQVELAKLNFNIMTQCYLLLRYLCLGPFPDGQVSLFRHIELFLTHIDDEEISLHAAQIVHAIFEGNRSIASQITDFQLRKILQQVARKKLPIFLEILHSAVLIDGKPFRRNQNMMAKLLVEKQNDVVVLYNDGPSLRRRNEMIKTLQFLNPNSELLYHLRLLDLFVLSCKGRVYEAEVKCQSLFSLDDLLFQIGDRQNWPRLKSAFLAILEEAYLLTERSLKNIAQAPQIWELMQVFIRDILGFAAHEFTARVAGSRHRLFDASLTTSTANLLSHQNNTRLVHSEADVPKPTTDAPVSSSAEPHKVPSARKGLLQVDPNLLAGITPTANSNTTSISASGTDSPSHTSPSAPRLIRRKDKMSSGQSSARSAEHSPVREETTMTPSVDAVLASVFGSTAFSLSSTLKKSSSSSESGSSSESESVDSEEEERRTQERLAAARARDAALSSESAPAHQADEKESKAHSSDSESERSSDTESIDSEEEERRTQARLAASRARDAAIISQDEAKVAEIPATVEEEKSDDEDSKSESSESIDSEEEERRSQARLAAARARDAAIIAESQHSQQVKPDDESDKSEDEKDSSSESIDSDEEDRRTQARLAASRARDAALIADSQLDAELAIDQTETSAKDVKLRTEEDRTLDRVEASMATDTAINSGNAGKGTLVPFSKKRDDAGEDADDESGSNSSSDDETSSVNSEEEERRTRARLDAARARDAALMADAEKAASQPASKTAEHIYEEDEHAAQRKQIFYDSERSYIFDSVLPFIAHFCIGPWAVKRFDGPQTEKLSEVIDAIYSLTTISHLSAAQNSAILHCMQSLSLRSIQGNEYKKEVSDWLLAHQGRPSAAALRGATPATPTSSGLVPSASASIATATPTLHVPSAVELAQEGLKHRSASLLADSLLSPLNGGHHLSPRKNLDTHQEDYTPPSSTETSPNRGHHHFHPLLRGSTVPYVNSSAHVSSEAVTNGIRLFHHDCADSLKPDQELVGLALFFKKDMVRTKKDDVKGSEEDEEDHQVEEVKKGRSTATASRQNRAHSVSSAGPSQADLPSLHDALSKMPSITRKLVNQLCDAAYAPHLATESTTVVNIIRALRILLLEPRVQSERAQAIEDGDSEGEVDLDESEAEHSFPGITHMFYDNKVLQDLFQEDEELAASMKSLTSQKDASDDPDAKKDDSLDGEKTNVPAFISRILGTLGPLGVALTKSLSEEPNKSDQFEEILTETQDLLNSIGCTSLVIQLITSKQEAVIVEAVRCGTALLWGGNKAVQEEMMRVFQNTSHGEIFFHEVRSRIRKGLIEIEERREMTRKRHFIDSEDDDLEEDDDQSSTAGSTPTSPRGSSRGSSSFLPRFQQPQDTTIADKGARDMRAMEELLRLLQLLCEGHNRTLQDCLRQQLDSMQSYDLITETASYLEALERNIDAGSVETAMQTFDTLTEYCQGPCAENQLALTRTKFTESINFLMVASNIRCNRLDRLRLQSAMLTALLSLLEGTGSDPSVPRHMLATMDFNLIETNIMEIVGDVSKLLNGERQSSSQEASSASSNSALGKIVSKLLPAASQKAIFDTSILPEEVQAQIECGYSYFFLLRILNDYDTSGRILRILQAFPPENFFSSAVGSLEIVRGGQLERIYYRIPPVCTHLTTQSKEDLIRNVKRTNQQEKLEDMFERSDHLLSEMEHREALANSPEFSTLSANEELFKNLSFGFSLLINLLIIAFYTSAPPTTVTIEDPTGQALVEQVSDPRSFAISSWVVFLMFLLALAQLACSCVTLFVYAVSNIPLLIRKQVQLPSWVPIHLLPEGSIWAASVKNTFSILSDTYLVYYLSYTVFAILGILSLPNAPYFFAFHLLDIVVRSELLKYVIKSVTANGKAIMLTACLALVVVYIYSIFGFLFFRSKFGPDAGCENMFMCLVTSINMGLRSGGGIGDVLEPPVWADSDTFWRIVYDSTFFFLVIVIMLNIIFGIIIDTFGELRTQNHEIEEDIKNKCFICGIDRETFDRSADGFDWHIENDHHLFHYINFFMYLRRKERTEYTGPEQYVADMLEAQDWTFMPALRAMCLGGEGEEEAEKSVQILDGLHSLTKNTSSQFDQLKRGLARKQAEVDEKMTLETQRTDSLSQTVNTNLQSYESRLELLERKLDRILGLIDAQTQAHAQTHLTVSRLAQSTATGFAPSPIDSAKAEGSLPTLGSSPVLYASGDNLLASNDGRPLRVAVSKILARRTEDTQK